MEFTNMDAIDRNRYHIIVKQKKFVNDVLSILAQSELTDVKRWKNFPLFLNASLNKEQAEWFKRHPYISFIEQTSSVHLHADTSNQYEIQTDGTVDLTALRNLIISTFSSPVSFFTGYSTSLFVTLTTSAYTELILLLAGNTPYAGVTNIVINNSPFKSYSRVLDRSGYNWGIERISHRSVSVLDKVKFTKTGSGVKVYVIDTGIHSNHEELKGRVNSIYKFDAFRDVSDVDYGNPSLLVTYEDGNMITDDHGTHVASIIGGSTVGVATQVELINVRAFSYFENSTTEHLLDAIDWVITTHSALGGPAIANLSFEISNENSNNSLLSDYIMSALISAGIICIVSAGNDNTDAFFVSPANAGTTRSVQTINSKQYVITEIDESTKPIVVGASVKPNLTSTNNDEIWYKSNWGDVVDIFAPGVEIFAASLTVENDVVNLSKTGNYTVKTGTSMSAPHVAGVCALHLQVDPSITHTQMKTILLNQATNNPFDVESVINDRIDLDQYETANIEISEKRIFSPNKLLFANYTVKYISWDTQDYEYSGNENNEIYFALKVQNLDQYNDNYEVNFTIEQYEVPNEFLDDNVITFYQTREIYKNVKNIYFNQDAANFRITLPSITETKTAKFILTANSDFETSSMIFSVEDVDVPRPPVWELPTSEGELTTDPVHKGDVFNSTTFVFRATSEDNLVINYSFSPADALPPGLIFVNEPTSNRAYLRGTITKLPVSDSLLKYEFVVRATDSNGEIAERLFWLTGEYINELHYFDTNWEEALYEYDSSYPDVYYLSTFYIGNSVNYDIPVINLDNGDLTYIVDFVSTLTASGTLFNGSLPAGLGIDSDGIISGVIDPSATAGTYCFTIIVTDTSGNSISKNLVIVLTVAPDDILDSSDQIEWVTPAGNIGYVYETYPSHVGVYAKNSEGTAVKYKLVDDGGYLPSGMTLDSTTGYILGTAPFVDYDLEYYFTIRAYVGSRYIDRSFSFKVLNLYSTSSIMNVSARVFGKDRLDIRDWFLHSDYVSTDELFRSSDPNFGSIQYPYMYIVNGLNSTRTEDMREYLKDYHKRMYLTFSTVSWAPAYDANGSNVYDVIYISVIDPLTKAGGFSELVENTLTEMQTNPSDEDNWDSESREQRYFNNNLINARKDLISTDSDRLGLGLSSNEGFPLYMRNSSGNGTFFPGVIVAYVTAGLGSTIVNRLIKGGFNTEFQGRNFIVDRYYISTIDTTQTIFDANSAGSATTVFDDPNQSNYQNEDLSNYTQPTLFDVSSVETGKYYKFEDDAALIAQRTANQYK
jgi:subtilisin family serine protease